MKSPIYLWCILAIITSLDYDVYTMENLKPVEGDTSMHVDFSYAFATPHRLSVSLPNSSDKTLVDVYPDYLRMKWSYENLLSKPLASFAVPTVNWEVQVKPLIDGQPFASSRWNRVEGWLPAVEQVYEESAVKVTLQAVAGKSAVIVKVVLQNYDNQPHQGTIHCIKSSRTASNPAWVQPDWDCDVLLAAYGERADRIMVFVIGGDEQPVVGPSTVSQVWTLESGQECTGWIIRPYQAYHSQLSALRRFDWSVEFEGGKDTWRQLINKAAQVRIPDADVENAFYAGLVDCFVMREPVTEEFIAGTPGTEKYRSASSGEPSIVAILLDQAGLHREAALGLQMCLEQQGEDGNWADPKGWAHYMWGISGFKAWAIMEHYRLTKDKEYLAAVYPRMVASSRWQEQQRAKTRVKIDGQHPLTYGLMPRGMGDCGLMDGDDLHGVFLPHNFWTVFADALTVQAAEILNKTDDLPELRRIHDIALDDLQQVLKRGAIQEAGYRWIPGVAGKTCGSRWGALYAAFPCAILPKDHELINGTIRKIESNISSGNIPVNTGWLQDGLWVAIALDNLAEVLLYRNEGDAAVKYLYATLNHATPLYSWCEERGQEAGSKKCTGDLQHLWTPLAVGRFIRDALVMEDGDTLHLARGVARQWLGSGQTVGVYGIATHFGNIFYDLKYDKTNELVSGFVELIGTNTPNVVLHIRLPEGKKVNSISSSVVARVNSDGRTIEWSNLTGKIHFEAKIK